ncbi:MAG TPA: hypothetical protein VLK82_18885 [Candidatus Tectomicrobia bacterium]|nr:hypothetical protein [Candidatus Tectomicrobia bacterium]
MSYAKRHMWEALDALGVAADEEGYPFEEMEEDPAREASECDDCGVPGSETMGDCVERRCEHNQWRRGVCGQRGAYGDDRRLGAAIVGGGSETSGLGAFHPNHPAKLAHQ